MEAKKSVPRENMASSKGPKTKKIFVGGIPPSITDGMLSWLQALAVPCFVIVSRLSHLRGLTTGSGQLMVFRLDIFFCI